jgi:hypothetical protein
MALLKVPKKRREEKLAKLSPAQRAELDRIEADAIADFKGQLDDLESALGMLRMGYQFGWKALYILHSKATVRKYEKILGISIRETFPEAGPSAYRLMGFRLAETVSNFWKLISGAAEEGKQMDRQERRRVEA